MTPTAPREWRPTRAPAALVFPLLAALVASMPAGTAVAGPDVQALLAAWHQDPARIDRARTLLETAAAANAVPETLVELSHVWFLTGEFRARSDAERVTAYERGSEWARRGISVAPRSERAHFLLAINSGRLAQMKGVMRALPLVTKIREESETVLRLNPAYVDGLILAAGLAAEMPAFMGGDHAKAEVLFKRALELDPHQSGGRLELARLYIATKRWHDAQRELQGVVGEPAPTDLPRWTVSERPRAQSLLAALHERGRTFGGAPQAP